MRMTDLDIVAMAKRCLELDREFRAEDWPSIISRVKRLGIPFELGNAAPLLAQSLLTAIEALNSIHELYFTDKADRWCNKQANQMAREALAKMGVK